MIHISSEFIIQIGSDMPPPGQVSSVHQCIRCPFCTTTFFSHIFHFLSFAHLYTLRVSACLHSQQLCCCWFPSSAFATPHSSLRLCHTLPGLLMPPLTVHPFLLQASRPLQGPGFPLDLSLVSNGRSKSRTQLIPVVAFSRLMPRLSMLIYSKQAKTLP